MSGFARIGDAVVVGQVLAFVHARRPDDARQANEAVKAAFVIGDDAPAARALIPGYPPRSVEQPQA